MKIVFMGTPDFAVPCLEQIIADGHDVVGVVTQPDRPKSRGMKMTFSPVKECALKYNIPIYQPEKIKKDTEFLKEYKELNPDLTVVVAFGQILPKIILDVSKKGCINLHGSLLPKYRGAAPIQWAVINGEEVTGVTTMFMDEGMDTGDIILKKEVLIEKDETAGELYYRLADIGAKVLSDTIKLIENGNVPREKQGADVTYASILNKELGNIDWTKSSREIDSLIRGVNPWPGAYFDIKNIRIKVHKAKMIDRRGEPGEILEADTKKGFIIATADGAIELLEIQPENKKRMTAKEYLMGNKIEKRT
jgi:methionyl-tRNA formyltransferase